ncbi:MAG: hypothetical protein OQL08_01445 [Gammaproteobacteria bacterium]|nr:hypothetical protein [Gammaproteobacteria bacterium]
MSTPSENENNKETHTALDLNDLMKHAPGLFDQWREYQNDKRAFDYRRFLWRLGFAMIVTGLIFATAIALIFLKDETSTGISILTHVVALLAGLLAGTVIDNKGPEE